MPYAFLPDGERRSTVKVSFLNIVPLTPTPARSYTYVLVAITWWRPVSVALAGAIAGAPMLVTASAAVRPTVERMRVSIRGSFRRRWRTRESIPRILAVGIRTGPRSFPYTCAGGL